MHVIIVYYTECSFNKLRKFVECAMTRRKCKSKKMKVPKQVHLVKLKRYVVNQDYSENSYLEYMLHIYLKNN